VRWPSGKRTARACTLRQVAGGAARGVGDLVSTREQRCSFSDAILDDIAIFDAGPEPRFVEIIGAVRAARSERRRRCRGVRVLKGVHGVVFCGPEVAVGPAPNTGPRAFVPAGKIKRPFAEKRR